MSIKIRNSVFETNSSSTHSLIMCSKDEYNKLNTRDLLIDTYNDSLITLKEAKDRYKEYFPDAPDIYNVSDFNAIQLLQKYDVAYTLEEYNENYNEYLNKFYQEYTTPSGETICAFGVYGENY